MPRIIRQTVRILNSQGDAQLSPDLVISEVFKPSTIFQRKEITLEDHSPRGELRVWYPNERSKSARIYLGRMIRALGIHPEDIVGKEYKGKATKGTVHIFLRKEIKRRVE